MSGIKGKTFCMTGTLSIDRDEVMNLIVQNKGKFKSSVTRTVITW